MIFPQNLKEQKRDEISKSDESPSKKRKSDEKLKREREMKFPQNQKWVSIKAEKLNKRIERKEWGHTKEQLEWNKERQMRRDFQEADSKASTDKKGESFSNV